MERPNPITESSVSTSSPTKPPPAELIRPVANWNTYVKNVEEMIRDLPELSREASVEEIETHVS